MHDQGALATLHVLGVLAQRAAARGRGVSRPAAGRESWKLSNQTSPELLLRGQAFKRPGWPATRHEYSRTWQDQGTEFITRLVMASQCRLVIRLAPSRPGGSATLGHAPIISRLGSLRSRLGPVRASHSTGDSTQTTLKVQSCRACLTVSSRRRRRHT